MNRPAPERGASAAPANAGGAPVPRREQASPLQAAPTGPDPYRLLFPIGVTWALVGAGVWPLHALHLIAYPGPQHRLLMIQGFEHSFVLGFLLTAMPGLTKGERCRPWELAIAVASALGFGLSALAGRPVLAQSWFLLSLLMVFSAIVRRLRRGTVSPPLELMFAMFGLLCGLAGGALQIATAAGWSGGPPLFGERLISLGMVLSLVLGVGGLLVPAFVNMRHPLAIPGIAGPHERRGRLIFYSILMAAFAVAFAAEWLGQPRAAAWLRAIAASIIVLAVWKLWRLPGRRDLPGFALWTSGWFVPLGLLAVAIAPPWGRLAGLHLMFIGGFGLLTFGIATRVVTVHGRHSIEDERRTLNPWVALLLALALVTRLAAEWMPDRALPLLGASGALWVLAWALWALRAVPRIVRISPPPSAPVVPVPGPAPPR